jgi:diguanylate cyclase (GGDEF)-like protein/PAS domain S-box-containing protein
MRKDKNFYKSILDNLYEGVYITDGSREIVYWNKEAERITGFRSDEVLGHHCFNNILMHVDEKGVNLCETGCPLASTIADGRMREAEVYLSHRQGHRIPVTVRVTPLRDSSGAIIGAVELFNDNSANVAALQRLEELEKLALIDPLTEVGNRRYSEDFLQDRLEELYRYGWQSGVIFIDIDHFKVVNDEFGHDVGDDVLRMVARTLVKTIRSFDFIGRWGGEEFVAVILNVTEKDVAAIAEKFRTLVKRSKLRVGDKIVRVAVSLGATLTRPNDTVESLMKRVDQLMYQSKSQGRNRVSVG